MLEEYLCLGGNEVANNARTYGYATTSGCPTSWFRCEPCATLQEAVTEWIPPLWQYIEQARNLATNPSFESTSGAVEVWRNLATNPSFETTSGTVEVRRNLALDPRAIAVGNWGVVPGATGVATVAAVTGVTGFPVTTAVRATWTTASTTVQGGLYYNYVPVVAATAYTFSIYVSASQAQRLQMSIEWKDSGGGNLSTSSAAGVDVVAGGVYRLSITATAPASAARGVPTVYAAAGGSGTVWALNSTLTGTAVLAEASSILGTYFDGATQPRLRENLIPNPSSAATVTGWSINSGSITTARAASESRPGSPTTGAVSFTVVSGTTNFDVQWWDGTVAILPQVIAGQVVTWSAWVKRSTAGGFAPKIRWRNEALTEVTTETSGATVTAVVGEWMRVSLTATVPVGATRAHPGVKVDAVTAGLIVYLDDALLEVAGALGSYFDGAAPDAAGIGYEWSGTANASSSYAYDLDLTPAWTGTANASASIMRGDQVAGFSAYNMVGAIKSSRWGLHGSSVRLIPNVAGNDSHVRYSLMPYSPEGKTYTVVATSRLEAAQTGSLAGSTQMRNIAIDITGGGAGTRIHAYSTPPANAAGITEQRLTFTVPQVAGSPVTALNVRLYNGASQHNGDVWWDDLLIIEGAYYGDYFDGDTVEPTTDDLIRWAGTPNASVSIWERNTLITAGHSAEPPYVASNLHLAPWYDADRAELTSRFYGAFILSIENLNSSTRSASVTEGILDGGVVGRVRHATREVRVRALAVAEGEDALEFGLNWLSAALDQDGCSQHGSTCGATDVTLLAACPGPPDNERGTQYVVPETRHLHNVTVISGPLVEQKIKSNNGVHWGYIVEWTMVAATPWLFSDTVQVPRNPQTPIIIQDAPFNLVPYPSAEIAGAAVTVATNYATNPSVETGLTGWTHAIGVITGTSTIVQSNELASVGTQSARGQVTTSNTSTAGVLWVGQEIALPAYVAGQRFSINLWASGLVKSGTAVLGNIDYIAIWRQTAGGATLRADTIGTLSSSGGAKSRSNILPPANANFVLVQAWLNVTSWSSGAVIALYSDAVAVTNP